MRKLFILTATVMLISSCGTTGSGAMSGAYMGGFIGSAIGGLAGGGQGSNLGTIIGAATGAAAGAAVVKASEKKASAQPRYERDAVYSDPAERDNSR